MDERLKIQVREYDKFRNEITEILSMYAYDECKNIVLTRTGVTVNDKFEIINLSSTGTTIVSFWMDSTTYTIERVIIFDNLFGDRNKDFISVFPLGTKNIVIPYLNSFKGVTLDLGQKEAKHNDQSRPIQIQHLQSS